MSLKAAGCCLVSLLACTNLAASDIAVLLPSKTNTLIQVNSSSGTSQLSDGQGDIYVGRTNQDGQGPATISIRRGLIAFDIADNIPAGATITGVTLTVDDVRIQWQPNGFALSDVSRLGARHFLFQRGAGGAAATNGDATWYYTFYNAANPSASPA